MNLAIRRILKEVRSDAVGALLFHGDIRALQVVRFLDSLVELDGKVTDEAILVASEMLEE
jgi:hypothetical protein